eukprot:TRINITY_DN61132_c0_g1_i1.p1 TRINITY_DN61132_c0_g1~~TRINITY_DN61132_c0_g1_i1.p1  ORF type:complete len:1602 (+),score=248.35 TRINITY_DN61132_c0_g1_i1:530-4807(+)
MLPVSDATCHPFRAGRLLFMHNGLLGSFQQLQPRLVGALCEHPAAFRVAAEHGLIDSAVAFGFLLVELGLGSASEQELELCDFSPEMIRQALARTIRHLCCISDEAGVAQESLLNFVVSDGRCVVACRYAWPGCRPTNAVAATTAAQSRQAEQGSDELAFDAGRDDSLRCSVDEDASEPPQATLYFAAGTQWAVASGGAPGMYRMQMADRRSRMAIISSEPLTSVREEWLPIPRDTFVVFARAFDPEGGARVPTGTVDVIFVPFDLKRANGLGPSISLSSVCLASIHGQSEHRRGGSVSSNPCSLGNIGCPNATSARHEDPQINRDDRGNEGFMCSEHVDEDAEAPLEIFATEYTGVGEATLLCVITIPPFGVLVAGSQDGGLRFFGGEGHRDQHHVRRHNGPVLALLLSPGPPAQSEPVPIQEGASKFCLQHRAGRARECSSPRFPVKRICSNDSTMEGSEEETSRAASPSGAGSDMVPRPSLLLFSTSTNELRVWDVSDCANSPDGPFRSVVCLFCFKFKPIQGRLESLAGDYSQLFVGFQSAKICVLRLSQAWDALFSVKSKSRSIRFFTFDLTRAGVAETEPQSKFHSVREFCGMCCDRSMSSKRFSHNSCLVDLNSQHAGSILAMAHHPTLQILASCSSDGSLFFWRSTETDAMCTTDSLPRDTVNSSPNATAVTPLVFRLAACYHESRPTYAVLLDDLANELFAGDSRGQIRVWDIKEAADGAGSKAIFGPRLRAGVVALQFSQKVVACDVRKRGDSSPGRRNKRRSQTLISGDTEGCVCIWDVVRGVLLQTLGGVELDYCGSICCLSEEGPLRLACCGTVGGDAKGTLQSLTLIQKVLEDKAIAAPVASDSRSDVGLQCQENVFLTSLLRQFVAIPCEAGHQQELHRGATWLRSVFERYLGASVRVCADGTVLARCGWDSHRPLVVLYSHYDVTPAGEGWSRDPWTLAGQDGWLYGRGAATCKGPLLVQILAARRLLQNDTQEHVVNGGHGVSEFVLDGLGDEPVADQPSSDVEEAPLVNLLFIADANGERGSPGLLHAVQEAREQGWLDAATFPAATSNESVDSSCGGRGSLGAGSSVESGGKPIGLLVTSGSWIHEDCPSLCYGARGVLDVEVRVSTGGAKDVHSGRAGVFSEPFVDLSALLASLTDASGRVAVPGFDARVRPLVEAERRNLEHVTATLGEARLKDLREEWLGLDPSEEIEDGGEVESQAVGAELLKRCWAAPALSVTDVRSSGGGEMVAKSRLIPRDASAVVSVRMVPGQESSEILAAVKAHLRFEFAKRRTSNRLEVCERSSFGWWEGSSLGPWGSSLFATTRRGVQFAWELPQEDSVLLVREGGSLPMLPALQAELGCETVQMPLGCTSDAAFLPDERVAEKNLYRGVQALWWTLQRLATDVTPVSVPLRSSEPREGCHRRAK